MDKQQNRKNISVEARLKRKSILDKKRINRFKRGSNESGITPHHTNEVTDNHLSRPAMYIETGIQSMTKKMINDTPLSDISKDQETSSPNHNISTARFRQPLISGNHSNSDEEYLSKNENREKIGVLNAGREMYSAIEMTRSFPRDGRVDVSVSALDSSQNYTSNGLLTNPIPTLPTTHIPLLNPSIDINSQDVLIRRASMYQDYMEQIPIPSHRGSVIPFTSWMGLGRSIKKLYGQPLHYLTNIMLKQWDKLRIGSEDEYKPLDEIIHPCKAEATVWLMEQVHRQTSSHFHIANLWKMDPMYNGSIDSIFPTLEHTS